MSTLDKEVTRTRNHLDVEVAVRLLRFRWVAWRDLDRFPVPSEEAGRFLAPPRGMLAADMISAGPEVPLAKDPYRYVPPFSSDVGAAFEVARQVGLFVEGNAFLNASSLGEWTVLTEDGKVWASSPCLPETICMASLEWDAARKRPEGGTAEGTSS